MATTANKRTYYKRVLPSPPAIAFSSAEGRQIFSEALNFGTMVGFFKLMEQFTTQEEPQYCGLAALAMTLNALGVDPRRLWKGSWRWFSETMLDCCKSMEDVKRDGLTLSQVACLARCNGADVSIHRHGTFDANSFRRTLREVCACEDRHMVVSYSRKAFKQSGDGHFSPVGGYHPQRDLVLILDVARFKYAPHWVRTADLMDAMGLQDPVIGRPRGFLLLSCRHPRESALFTVSATPIPTPSSTSAFTSSTERYGKATIASSLRVDEEVAGPHTLRALPFSAAAGPRPASPFPLPQRQRPHTQQPAWADAVRFLKRDGPALMRRLVAGDPQEHPPDETDGDDVRYHDESEGAEPESHGTAEQAGTTAFGEGPGATAAASCSTSCGNGGRHPSLESLVAALVAAAPLHSVCALLTRRPTLGAIGEVHSGPCCGCSAGPGASSNGASAGADTAAKPAPCNSGCGAVRLTAAAVAAAATAAGAHACRNGSPGAIAAAAGPAAAAAQLAGNTAWAGQCTAASAASSQCLGGSPPSSFGLCGREMWMSRIQSTGSLSSASEVGSLGSGGPTDSSVGSLDSGSWVLSSGSSGHAVNCSSGGSSGGVATGNSYSSSCSTSIQGTGSSRSSSCCHGEALEHHCVPPQVQALVVEELRFTSMYKLVSYCLRRQHGCPHVRAPDLTAFMHPAGTAKPAKAPQVASFDPTLPVPADSTLEDGPDAAADAAKCDCGDLGLPDMAAEKLSVFLLLLPDGSEWWPQLSAPQQQSSPPPQKPPAQSPPLPPASAAVPARATPTAPCAQGPVTTLSPIAAAATGAAPIAAAAAPGTTCAAMSTTSGTIAAADLAGPGAQRAGGGCSGGSGGVRVCGRPCCRRCRRRAAEAGDRAAALVLLREAWGQTVRLAPLGLYASVPVLREEISYLRLQLSQLDSCSRA